MIINLYERTLINGCRKYFPAPIHDPFITNVVTETLTHILELVVYLIFVCMCNLIFEQWIHNAHIINEF